VGQKPDCLRSDNFATTDDRNACAIDIWVRGHSRSLQMAPFDRLHTNSYSYSVMLTKNSHRAHLWGPTMILNVIQGPLCDITWCWMSGKQRQLCKLLLLLMNREGHLRVTWSKSQRLHDFIKNETFRAINHQEQSTFTLATFYTVVLCVMTQ